MRHATGLICSDRRDHQDHEWLPPKAVAPSPAHPSELKHRACPSPEKASYTKCFTHQDTSREKPRKCLILFGLRILMWTECASPTGHTTEGYPPEDTRCGNVNPHGKEF